ncbi:MAG: replication restart helicase PriA [Candidatus Limnocylindrales bacterium]
MESGPVPAERLVEVAVDVGGRAGDRTYTYRVPPELAGLGVGEAVLVEFGRRQVLGVVLGEGDASGLATKPISARVRSDGPLLPALQLRLVRAVARHYRAPLALVVRAALPPGLLERVELVAVPTGEGSRAAGEGSRPAAGERARHAAADGAAAGLLASVWSRGPAGVPIRRLPWGDSRAGLLRELRSLEREGRLRLEWRLGSGGGAPRLERRAALSERGRELLDRDAAGAVPRRAPAPAAGEGRAARQAEPAPSRGAREPRLGPRQAALLGALATLAPGDTAGASELAAVHGAAALARLARRGLVELTVVARPRRPLAGRSPAPEGAAPVGAALGPAQREAAEAIVAAIRGRHATAFLLESVTGAGRTAVYGAVIDAARAAGRQALLLVPEVALASPLVDRLRGGFGLDVALLHGGLSEGERSDEWRRIRSGEAGAVVGTRGAVLAPLADLGVVIVDEEHDPAYKSDRTPRYQARDVALQLGALASAPVVLGSATPDVVTLGRVLGGEIARLRLPLQPVGHPPRVEVVDLRAELAAGNRGLLSRVLADALTGLDRAAGGRAILVINRRGSASVVLCRDCGYVQVCPECRRPLVYHAAAAALRCHHCGATAPLATRCPACGSPRIRYLGGGTERLEHEVRVRFPDYRVARLDRDVLARRGAGERVLDGFRDGLLDVLVGTGMVVKGPHVPEVSLVGVVSADVAMNLPDLRASERTYQLLAQAVGRVGRVDRPGRAIIQTYQPDHPAVVAARTGEPERFYRAELESRRQLGLPPFGRLAKLTVSLADRAAAEAEAEREAARLRSRDASVEVLGPVPAYVPRRAGRWRFHLVLRGPDPVRILDDQLGPAWSVDVDPESLL